MGSGKIRICWKHALKTQHTVGRQSNFFYDWLYFIHSINVSWPDISSHSSFTNNLETVIVAKEQKFKTNPLRIPFKACSRETRLFHLPQISNAEIWIMGNIQLCMKKVLLSLLSLLVFGIYRSTMTKHCSIKIIACLIIQFRLLAQKETLQHYLSICPYTKYKSKAFQRHR